MEPKSRDVSPPTMQPAAITNPYLSMKITRPMIGGRSKISALPQQWERSKVNVKQPPVAQMAEKAGDRARIKIYLKTTRVQFVCNQVQRMPDMQQKKP